MTRDEWEKEGRLHAKREQNAIWEIAWWLVEGQVRAWDVGFVRSMEILGRASSTLENYLRVGRAFPRGKNHPDLTFTAHRELLREPDETARLLVLSEAIEHHWNAEDIVKHFERHPPTLRPLVGVDSPPSSKNKAPYLRKYYLDRAPRVQCPSCGAVFPIKGHKMKPAPTPTVVASTEPTEVEREED